MGLKKLVVNALALGPTSRGFTGGEARRWVRQVYRHYTRDYGYSRKETRWAIRHGFMPEQVDKLLALGDLYLLHPTLEPDPTMPHNFESRQKDVTIAFHRDWGMDGNSKMRPG